jgi:hypothetical protein
VPHSLDLRFCDRAAVEALSRAVSAFDREALGLVCQIVRRRLQDPEFRGGAGRMDDSDWGSGLSVVASGFEERLRRGDDELEDIQDYLFDILPKLQAVYTMPFFQADYELRARIPPEQDWISTRGSLSGSDRKRFYNGLTRGIPSGVEVRIEVPQPCSFVSFGFLDSGAFRAARAREESRIAALLDQAKLVDSAFADVMWLASTAWLEELTSIVRSGAPPAADPVFEHVRLLRSEADTRGYDIMINGWYGPSTTSEVTPLAWSDRSAAP